MNTNKVTTELYELFCKLFGKAEAKLALSDVISISIDQIEEVGLQVTEEELSQRLAIILEDYQQASKDHVA